DSSSMNFGEEILLTSGDFPCRPSRPHLQRVPRPQPNSTNKDPKAGEPNSSTAEAQPTVEDIYLAYIDNDRGGKEKVQFFDSAGVDSSCAEVSKAHLSQADGIVLLYAINQKESFLLLEQLKKDIDKHKEKKELAFLVIGNKADLNSERQVDIKSAISWATKERVRLVEVSAFDRKSLIEPFVYLVSKINPPP
ncbi:hypothetical protein HPB47_008132, partial [Ixodes persulcatus]